MADPAAAADNDEASYTAFVSTAEEEIEARVELLVAELIQQVDDERRAHARR